MTVSPAETADAEMPFGIWTWVGPSDCVLDRGPEPSRKGGNFGGCCLVEKHQLSTVRYTAKEIIHSSIVALQDDFCCRQSGVSLNSSL